MGGSAASGDFLQMVLGREMKVQLWVNRNYGAPGFVGPDTLSLLCSYSGNTEETGVGLPGRSCRRSPHRLYLVGRHPGSPGPEHGHPWPGFPAASLPDPLWAFFRFPVWRILSRLVSDFRVATGNWRSVWNGSATGSGPTVPIRRPPPTRPSRRARVLHGRIPFVYGSQDRLELVARRWCGQFAENGKQLSCLEGPSRNEPQRGRGMGNIPRICWSVYFLSS